MAPSYYTDLFSPETYEAFARSPRVISGFRLNQQPHAQRVKPGDKFVCYMTKLSRWYGVLEVQSACFLDETPLFYASDDPFVVRFKTGPIVWLSKGMSLPRRPNKKLKPIPHGKVLPSHSTVPPELVGLPVEGALPVSKLRWWTSSIPRNEAPNDAT
jgi:hypothetical protein